MKIGIVTYWWSQCNYGQVLQAYALQRILALRGHKPFTIRYNHSLESLSFGYLFRKWPMICWHRLGRLLRLRVDMVNGEREAERDFDGFRVRNMKWSERTYSSIRELCANPPACDICITGSDQVWNPQLWGRPYVNRVHFLDFGPERMRRIAFSASIGVPKFPLLMRRQIARLLRRFDGISVRESSSVPVLKGLSAGEVEVMQDPTLLAGRETFAELVRKGRRPVEGRYCFVYIIGDRAQFPLRQILDFAERRGLTPVFCLSGFTAEVENRKLSIEDWLCTMAHADYVITNSFHGTVFSVLNERPFANLPLKGAARCLSSRIVDLLKHLGVGLRYYDEARGFPEEQIDFSVAHAALDADRWAMNRFLKRIEVGVDE